MFLKAGAVSLALLLASRLLGLVRESAQAAAFGASGLADVAVLMLTLPDWLAGVLASGALAYVLLPAWAGQGAAQVRASQRRVTVWLLAGSLLLALALLLLRAPAVDWLAGGLPALLRPQASQGLAWSALALPAAMLAALWATRLQHQRDFTGLYGANLVVNTVLITAIAGVGWASGEQAITWLGLGLLAAMGLRLAWLWRRQAGAAAAPSAASHQPLALPAPPVWLWAALSAGLPLALPFAARSIASQAGEGALATFNYAWKLVELPLLLAIQLVATLAFPAVAAAFSGGVAPRDGGRTVRLALALAWTLACAAAAALLLGAPALGQLLFGWGRLDAVALERIAQWGAIAAWGLLPQALIAVALTVLAAQARMRMAVAAYGLGLLTLLLAASWGVRDGAGLMRLLNAVFAGVAVVVVLAMGRDALRWMPWRAMVIGFAGLLLVAGASAWLGAAALGLAGGLAAAVLAAALVLAASWLGSSELRQALQR